MDYTEADLAMAQMEVWMRDVREKIPPINSPEQLAGYVKGMICCAIALVSGPRGLTFEMLEPTLGSMADEVAERLFQVVDRAWMLRQ